MKILKTILVSTGMVTYYAATALLIIFYIFCVVAMLNSLGIIITVLLFWASPVYCILLSFMYGGLPGLILYLLVWGAILAIRVGGIFLMNIEADK